MIPAIMLVSIRLFLRLLLGLILGSTAVSKLTHQQQFRQGILDYQVIPSQLERRMMLSMLLAICIPVAELIAGLGFLTGLFLVPTLVLAIALFVLFSYATVYNLLKGRNDLSCHCGGSLGNHRISWWLVGRNMLFVACTLFLLIPSADPFTLGQVVRGSSAFDVRLWISIALPVGLLVVGVLLVGVLVNAARNVLRS